MNKDEALALAEVKGIIHSLVDKACRHHPALDREELKGETTIVALQAIRQHNPQKIKLASWVWLYIERWIISSCRSCKWRQRFSKPTGIPHPEKVAQERFNLEELLWQVSQEAKEVIELALNLKLKRINLTKCLKQLGWDSPSIHRTFTEIRKAITP